MKVDPLLTVDLSDKELRELKRAADGYVLGSLPKSLYSAFAKCKINVSPSPRTSWLRGMSRLVLLALSLRKSQMSKQKKFKKINEHALALEITKKEGGAISVSVAQVKEIQKAIFDRMAKMKLEQVVDLIHRHKTLLLIALLYVCLQGLMYAKDREEIQIMPLADRQRILQLLPRVEAGPIRDALRDIDGIWYDMKSMGVPVQAGTGNNAANEFPETGKLGVMNGMVPQAIRSLDLSSEPLTPVPGGTFRSGNVSSIKRLVLPNRPKGSPYGSLYPFVYYTDELDGFLNPNPTVTGFDLTYPVGTIALEPIFVNDLDNQQHYPCIIRARIRHYDSYGVLSACPVRTAEECYQAIEHLRPTWQDNPMIVNFMKHLTQGRMVKVTRRHSAPGNQRFGTVAGQIFTVTAQVDTLPPLPADLVRDILTKIEFKESSGYEWKPGCPAPTTKEEFHIVPRLYDGPFIPIDSTGCARCHAEVQISARRHDPNNNKIAWMGGAKEGFISGSHVDPSILTNTPTSDVKPRKQWLDTGVIALHDGDPVKFPKSVYHRIVVPAQRRLK